MRKVGKVDSRGKNRVQTVNTEPSMTVQSDAHLADIQQILTKYGATGQESLDDVAMNFADVSEFGDYHDVMMEVRLAEETFMKLPSKVREIFGHNVETWLDSAHDEDKRDALVQAGFLEPREVDNPVAKKRSSGGDSGPAEAEAGTAGEEGQGS